MRSENLFTFHIGGHHLVPKYPSLRIGTRTEFSVLQNFNRCRDMRAGRLRYSNHHIINNVWLSLVKTHQFYMCCVQIHYFQSIPRRYHWMETKTQREKTRQYYSHFFFLNSCECVRNYQLHHNGLFNNLLVVIPLSKLFRMSKFSFQLYISLLRTERVWFVIRIGWQNVNSTVRESFKNWTTNKTRSVAING